eukprot:TRINITY_DN5008_c0_g1_i1.p1 TRINITY_DN5008_c0_g1~~TRINITY_DN5008_c0_g1_i1.p1  ORF type:complete len:611 (+),score=85.19 TRINITY_DN5008_c0_g1_i1:106-1938(+)
MSSRAQKRKIPWSIAQFQPRKLAANITFTALYFLFFILAQNYHHRSTDSFELRKSFGNMRDYVVTSEDEFGNVRTSKSFDTIRSINDIYVWLSSSFVPLLWTEGEYGRRGGVADSNRLLGGVRLIQTKLPTADCKSKSKRPELDSLYNLTCFEEDRLDVQQRTKVGPSVLEATDDGSHLYWLDLAQNEIETNAHIVHMKNRSWLSVATKTAFVQGAFYNGQYDLFAFVEVKFERSRSGFMKRSFSTFTLPGSVYSRGVESVSLWLDAVALFFLVMILVVEIWQVIEAFVFGFATKHVCSIYRLATIWTVMFGGGFCATWFYVSTELDTLSANFASKILPAGVPGNYEPGEIWGYEWEARHASLNYLFSEIARVSALMRNMQLAGYWYSIVLLIKFFEGFELRPRMAMITWTFQESWNNLLHFMVVFLIIFCVFALGAHWLFGHILLEWSDPISAVASSFRALMGDFDFPAMYAIAPISTMCWFFLFMIFIYLVLLNQFIAILLDAYQVVSTRIEKADAASKEKPASIDEASENEVGDEPGENTVNFDSADKDVEIPLPGCMDDDFAGSQSMEKTLGPRQIVKARPAIRPPPIMAKVTPASLDEHADTETA